MVNYIPAPLVALTCGLAALAWVVFARSQSGRLQAGVLGWLGLPYLVLACLFVWFALTDVPIELRGMHSRIGYMTLAASHAIILFWLSYLQRGKHGRK
jgi:hypothetical protein